MRTRTNESRVTTRYILSTPIRMYAWPDSPPRPGVAKLYLVVARGIPASIPLDNVEPSCVTEVKVSPPVPSFCALVNLHLAAPC